MGPTEEPTAETDPAVAADDNRQWRKFSCKILWCLECGDHIEDMRYAVGTLTCGDHIEDMRYAVGTLALGEWHVSISKTWGTLMVR